MDRSAVVAAGYGTNRLLDLVAIRKVPLSLWERVGVRGNW